MDYDKVLLWEVDGHIMEKHNEIRACFSPSEFNEFVSGRERDIVNFVVGAGTIIRIRLLGSNKKLYKLFRNYGASSRRDMVEIILLVYYWQVVGRETPM